MRDGDPSPDGAGPLVSARGIEIGHIFQLGRKYTDAFAADVLGEDGKPVRLTMGSYGIGVSRLVAVIAEQHHDELGLRWPSSVSPFDVHVVIANKDAEAARPAPPSSPRTWTDCGLDVLLDDRTASPGVKFKDAELLGVPWVVVVGRGWANGVVELRNRFTGEKPRGRRRRRRPTAIDRGCPRRSRSVTPTARERLGQRPRLEHLPPASGQHARLGQRRHREHATVAVELPTACSSTARQATAASFSIRTARLAASVGVGRPRSAADTRGGQRRGRPDVSVEKVEWPSPAARGVRHGLRHQVVGVGSECAETIPYP